MLEKFNVVVFSTPSIGIPVWEKIEGSYLNNGFIFQKYIPSNHVIKAINPDKLIKSTFKLGLSENEINVKNWIILPHFKAKQIEQMQTATLLPLDVEWLPTDEEQDDDEDLDV